MYTGWLTDDVAYYKKTCSNLTEENRELKNRIKELEQELKQLQDYVGFPKDKGN